MFCCRLVCVDADMKLKGSSCTEKKTRLGKEEMSWCRGSDKGFEDAAPPNEDTEEMFEATVKPWLGCVCVTAQNRWHPSGLSMFRFHFLHQLSVCGDDSQHSRVICVILGSCVTLDKGCGVFVEAFKDKRAARSWLQPGVLQQVSQHVCDPVKSTHRNPNGAEVINVLL